MTVADAVLRLQELGYRPNPENGRVLWSWNLPGDPPGDREGAEVTRLMEMVQANPRAVRRALGLETAEDSGSSTPQKKDKPSPAEVGERLLGEERFIFAWERLWVYRDGCYRPDGEQVARAAVQEILGQDARKRDGDEVVYWLSNVCRVSAELVNAGPLVNLRNGLLDPLTGELLPHDPDYLSTIQLPVEWDPEAYHERLDRFLDEVLPSRETRLLLEEAFGYALAPDCRFEKAIMFTGDGSNGKSVALEVFTRMLGPENVSNVKLQDLGGNRFKAAELVGKLANVYADLPREALDETDVFKVLVSGDRLSAERKYSHPFEFRNRAKLYFSANELPRTKDRTPAFFRRWVILPFPYRFTPDGERKADPTLREQLTAHEALSYLLRLAVEGLQRLVERRRFTETSEAQAALEQYRRESDSVLAFVGDACELKPDLAEAKQALYAAYRAWCETAGMMPVNIVHFGRSILGLDGVSENRPEINGRRVRRYNGIGLLDRELIGQRPPIPGDEDAPPARPGDRTAGSDVRQARLPRPEPSGELTPQAQAIIERRPERPCGICGGQKFWRERQPGKPWLCARCHPPHVSGAEWLDLGGDES